MKLPEIDSNEMSVISKTTMIEGFSVIQKSNTSACVRYPDGTLAYDVTNKRASVAFKRALNWAWAANCGYEYATRNLCRVQR